MLVTALCMRFVATLRVSALALVAWVGPATAQDVFASRGFLPPAPQWSGASEALVRPATDKWATPAEVSGFETSPSYTDTIAWLKKADRSSSLIRLETFGRTPEGSDMVAVIVSRDGARLKATKPVLLIQAGIHAGEIDGKDAGLMLVRDIAFGGRRDLIDAVNIVFVPVFNADGHERASLYSRPNQRGPAIQGWRHTAQNLNLNRDYMKADAPEMQAMLALINRYDPALYIDLHVTDGLDYRYDITFGFDGWDGRYADSPAIGAWLDSALRPAIETSLKDAGHFPGPLIFARNEADLTKGIDLSAFAARFSHAYGDLRRLPTVLVENHSLKPWRQRVLGTYTLLEAALKQTASDSDDLRTAITADRALRPALLAANWKTAAEPAGSIPFETIEATRIASFATGGEMTAWTGQRGPVVSAPVYVSEPGAQLSIPVAYWVPATKSDVIARLRAHGVIMEAISAPHTLEVDMIRFGGFDLGRPLEGRVPVTAKDMSHEQRAQTFPPGSVRIATDQPLGVLAAALLEPENEDSFFAWGFFNEILNRVEYMEPYAIAPMADAMLAADSALKAEFEARLAADQDFAASPRQRLAFFYERSPYVDDRYLLYPVGREMLR